MSSPNALRISASFAALSAVVACSAPGDLGSAGQGLRTEFLPVISEPTLAAPVGAVELFVEVDDLLGAPVGTWSADEDTHALISALARRRGNAALGLAAAGPERLAIQIDPELQSGLVLGKGLAKDGRYAVVEVEMSSPECGETGISPDEILFELAADSPGFELDGPLQGLGDPTPHSQGICGALSVAHSLVDHLNVVWTHWDGIVDPTETFWDPAFLQAVILAAGGELAKGGLTSSQMGAGHTADWNTAFDVAESQALTTFDRSSCETVRESCQQLAKRKEDERDDCLLMLSTDTELPAGEEEGHVMSIQSVVFDESTCTCNITTDHTGAQDPADDYVGVPFAPGSQTWAIGVASLTQTGGVRSAWWNGRGFQRAQFQCWAETRDADGGDRPEPGAARP